MDVGKAFLLLFLAVMSPFAVAQTGRTVRHTRVPTEESASSAAVTQAEAAIEKKDYATAEQRLNEAVAKNPTDYQAWYDLGYVFSATGRKAEAIEAYRKSVTAKPDVFESNLNLGTLLAATHQPDAADFLRKATQLKPTAHREEGLERAWLSLGHVVEKENPQEALEAFEKAAQLQPKDAEPYLAAGAILERQDKLTEAEEHYAKAAQLDPKSSDALAGLVNVYTRQKRLPEAESALRKYLAIDANNVSAHVQLGRVLLVESKPEEASAEFQAALKLDPNDPTANQEIAAALVQAKKFDEAAARYQPLVQANPRDPTLRYQFGSCLLKARKFADAQAELLDAVQLKPDLAEAYEELAIAASENQNYPLAIKAVDTRARFLPETPGTYFLRATSYDHLRAYKEAAESYRQFLLAAAGKFPDQEWQARHRLLAIDPKAKK